MARAKAEGRREAILAAAVRVFAERGLDAATSAVSRQAGVAEGTLFTYFPTKGELVNALFRELNATRAAAMAESLARKGPVRARMQHLWERSVAWGIAHPNEHRVLRRIELWDGLGKDTRKTAAATSTEVKALAEEARQQGGLRDLPKRFVAATFEALAERVVELALDDPKRADLYRTAGLEMFWSGVAAGR